MPESRSTQRCAPGGGSAGPLLACTALAMPQGLSPASSAPCGAAAPLPSRRQPQRAPTCTQEEQVWLQPRNAVAHHNGQRGGDADGRHRIVLIAAQLVAHVACSG